MRMLRQARRYRALLGKSVLSSLTGTTTPSLRKKLARAFSPPLAPSFVAAFAALRVSLWRRMSAVATGIFILTKRQHPHFAQLVRMFSPRAPLMGMTGTTTPSLRAARSNVFSSCSSFVFMVRFRVAKTTKALYRFRDATLFYHFFRLAAQPMSAPSVYTTIKTKVAMKTNSTLERRSSVTLASMKQAAIVAA